MPFSFSIYSYNIAGKTETFARNFMIEILESQTYRDIQTEF
tara:strand:- start:1962 stop:2084 length:123 start_codon:yes stop_codon:yes gene_type:complete